MTEIGDTPAREATQQAITRLAVAIYHNKGAYALLLGSGLSRSAGIPTGWELVLDLIRQISAVSGEPCAAGDEVKWYRQRFGAEPTYDALLDRITGFKVERAQLLADYIEPTDAETTEGTKVPQEAHRAIARLVRDGYIRVIVTTNFDHLLEDALRHVNVTPRIVSTPEAVEQALPLVHEQCTVIKVHGDYTSGELKNTLEELASYDDRLNRLLERVFSDFGLIVCGWSGEWDHALRAVLGANGSRAYSMFWTVKGQLMPAAESVVVGRHGKAVITIDDADSFFQTLEEKVAAIRDVLESQSLAPDMAVATITRYLSDPYQGRIRVHDLVLDEVKRLLPWLDDHVVLPDQASGAPYFLQELPEFDRITASLIAMYVVGVRWGEREQYTTWTEGIDTLLSASKGRSDPLRWGGFWAYLGALLLYGGGMASLVAGRYDTLHALISWHIVDVGGRRKHIVEFIADTYKALGSVLRQTPQWARHYVPFSEQMHEALREPMSRLIADDARYDEVFNRFEYFLDLVYVDARLLAGEPLRQWAPVGRYLWHSRWSDNSTVIDDVNAEVDRDGEAWPPLQGGLFGANIERFRAARDELRQMLDHWRQHLH